MSPTPAELDRRLMLRALALARRGGGRVHPNPQVGCVVARGEQVLGQGWHRAFGGPHAEVWALQAAGRRARGATAYVTLEPCSHFGKTPPCAEALIAAGISRVVAAMPDPNPLVAGRGLARLREAGVAVEVGLEGEAAADLNRAFVRFVTSGLPWVTLKVAMTLDGKLADHRGSSQWITGEPARREGHRLRRDHRAVLTGIGTALADDPSLTVRLVRPDARRPVRVVLDSRLRLPLESALVRSAGQVPLLVLHGPAASRDQAAALASRGVALACVAADGDGRLSLGDALRLLAAYELSPVLVEAGSALTSAFLAQGLVDELACFLAPAILGDDAALPAFRLPGPRDLSARLRGELREVTRVGGDLLARIRLH
jgi:diaminohydroxyphosphoribosylaminopyrimidine deaminase/5-amino-6-(5-phosphoribosylamino)uracil reductase